MRPRHAILQTASDSWRCDVAEVGQADTSDRQHAADGHHQHVWFVMMSFGQSGRVRQVVAIKMSRAGDATDHHDRLRHGLVALAEQTQFILENAEVLAGFVGNLQDVISYFLGTTRAAPAGIPSTKQARQIGSIVEPIAKDSASQMNIAIAGGVHFHAPVQINLTSLEANAVQNAAARFLGPSLPASCVASDQLMTLDQVKNRLKAKTGDYGIIETITDRPVRLQFLSEEAKRAVLELDHENPLQSVFLVDVEVRTVEGKPRLYRIIEVKDVIPKD